MTAADIARAEPEAVGLSSVRLRRSGKAMRREVEAARMPGLRRRHRARRQARAHGGHRLSRSGGQEPLKTDAVVVASMAKPMAWAAIMMLVEEGRSCSAIQSRRAFRRWPS